MPRKKQIKMLCKKHPEANLNWQPNYNCRACEYLFHKRCADSRFLRAKKDLRKSTPEDEHMRCDARAYAERYDFGNHDPERI